MKDFETLEFYIGGYPGPYHTIHLDCAMEQVKVNYKSEGILPSFKLEVGEIDRGAFKEFIMSADTSQRFKKELVACNIDSWKDNYVEDGVLDGTSWRLTIKYANDKQLTKSGSNKYPVKWNKFLGLMQKYIDKGIC